VQRRLDWRGPRPLRAGVSLVALRPRLSPGLPLSRHLEGAAILPSVVKPYGRNRWLNQQQLQQLAYSKLCLIGQNRLETCNIFVPNSATIRFTNASTHHGGTSAGLSGQTK